MKILVLGITGRTGQLVAEEAIKRGHQVAGIAWDFECITKTRLLVAGYWLLVTGY